MPTPNAVHTDRNTETRGMVVHSASPVVLPDGRTAALVGGILLNQNLEFIDTINDLVYREASLPEGSHGTATLFLEDVRISTNVRLFEGRRALGTRVSSVVRSTVLDSGRIWLDSAFVVNDWYISGYEPIVDSYDTRVGMLYVEFLEAPFTRAKYATLLAVAVAFLGITVASVPIFLRWARAIFMPLERMTGTIAKVERGDLGARTDLPAAADEIGRVALHLDHLLDQLQERDRQLREWNDELNTRVNERTHELQLANRQLEATTKQLIMSEKLAAIGEITAGVAHEINNPIAVMQGNLTLRHAPAFTLVVILTLGLGIGANTAIFSLMDQVLLRLLPVKHPEELVQLDGPGPFSGRTMNDRTFSYPMYHGPPRSQRRLRRPGRSLPDSAPRSSSSGQAERVDVELVSGNTFEVLGVRPVLGRALTPDDDRTSGRASGGGARATLLAAPLRGQPARRSTRSSRSTARR